MKKFQVEYQMASGKLYVSDVLKANSKEELERKVKENISYATVILVAGYHLIVSKIETFKVLEV